MSFEIAPNVLVKADIDPAAIIPPNVSGDKLRELSDQSFGFATKLRVVQATAATPATTDHVIPTDSGFNTGLKDWYDGSTCGDGDPKLFYFRVGQQAFAAPVDRIINGMPSRISKMEKASSGTLVMHVPHTAGCKSDPVEFVSVELQGDSTTPRGVLLLQVPARPDGDTPFTKYLRHLGETNACKKGQKPNLLACVGGHVVGEKKVGSIFLVVTDDQGKVHLQPSKDPTYADCQQVDDVFGCTIVEELGSGVKLKSVFFTTKQPSDAEQLSADQITKSRAALDAFVDKMKVQ